VALWPVAMKTEVQFLNSEQMSLAAMLDLGLFRLEEPSIQTRLESLVVLRSEELMHQLV
jgi:hypothetical protein